MYFVSPKCTKRDNSNKILLVNQSLKGIENIYRDVAGYDMSNDVFKQLCRESCEKKRNYLHIDRSEKRSREVLYL